MTGANEPCPAVPSGAGEQEVLALLLRPSTFPVPGAVRMIETHMSRVFLVGDRAYKMKKALRLEFADFTSLEARRLNCQREFELNQRLAPGVYRELVPVVRRREGQLALGGPGEPIEWLLVMRRLDSERLLEQVIATGAATPGHVTAIAEVLARFYREAPRIGASGAELLDWWETAVARVEHSLGEFGRLLPPEPLRVALHALRAFLAECREPLAARAQSDRIVDGHGDLRPEHVFVGPPLLLIDRLEFDPRLRWADPFDEAVFLGLECERLGAEWIGPQLIRQLTRLLDDRPPLKLLRLYRCYRACLRASLSIEHLRDAAPRTPERWPRQAADYLAMALGDPCQSRQSGYPAVRPASE